MVPIQLKNYEVITSHGRISVAETPGSGIPLFLIHGNSLCKEVFGPQFAFFAGRRRLIAIDLPGHGRSADAIDPRRTYSLSGYADCAAECLTKIGVDRAAVLGWSLGGHVALEMIPKYSCLLRLMIVGAPPFVRTDDGFRGFKPDPRFALASAGVLSEAQIDEFVTLASDCDSPPEPFWREAVARTHPIARQYLFEDVLLQEPARQRDLAEACPVPLAIVNGAADQLVDLEYVASLNYRNLWSGQMHVFEGLGHAPHIHAPDRFNALLERFLAGENGPYSAEPPHTVSNLRP